MSSWRYAACCLIVAACAYASGEPRRERSYGSKSGLKSGFAVSSLPHWLGALSAESADGDPLASRQGELRVGSVNPIEKRSSSFVALIVPPNFRLWLPVV